MSENAAHPTGCGESTEATKAKTDQGHHGASEPHVPANESNHRGEREQREPEALGGVQVPEVPPEQHQLVVPPARRDVGRHLPTEGKEDAHHGAEPDRLRREEERDLAPGVSLPPALEEQVVDREAHHGRAPR